MQGNTWQTQLVGGKFVVLVIKRVQQLYWQTIYTKMALYLFRWSLSKLWIYINSVCVTKLDSGDTKLLLKPQKIYSMSREVYLYSLMILSITRLSTSGLILPWIQIILFSQYIFPFLIIYTHYIPIAYVVFSSLILLNCKNTCAMSNFNWVILIE